MLRLDTSSINPVTNQHKCAEQLANFIQPQISSLVSLRHPFLTSQPIVKILSPTNISNS